MYSLASDFFHPVLSLWDSFKLQNIIVDHFFSFPYGIYIVWIHHNLFTHPTIDGYLGDIQFGAVMNEAAGNSLLVNIRETFVTCKPKGGLLGDN